MLDQIFGTVKRSDVHLYDLTDIDFSLIPKPTIV